MFRCVKCAAVISGVFPADHRRTLSLEGAGVIDLAIVSDNNLREKEYRWGGGEV